MNKRGEEGYTRAPSRRVKPKLDPNPTKDIVVESRSFSFFGSIGGLLTYGLFKRGRPLPFTTIEPLGESVLLEE
jgi:hypothetical protein